MKTVNLRKWTKLAIVVAVFATLLLLPSPVQHYVVYGQGYGYGYYEPPPPTAGGGVTQVVTAEGVFTKTTTFKSADGKANIIIPKGTQGKTKEGEPISGIYITQVLAPPAPPENTGFIGLTYDLEPDGATFDPPITIRFSYNPNWIPEGLGPENLTIAYYDEDAEKWIQLDAEDITIDPDNNTISAKISHFTYFSVMIYSAPAAFTVSDLAVTPEEVEIAQSASVSAVVSNTGDVAGSYKVTLKVNSVTVATKMVTLAGHTSETVTFTVIQGVPGSYKVNVDGLSATLTVKPAPVKKVVIPPAVPSVTVPPVEYPAPAAPPPPTMPAPVPQPIPWPAIIISLVIAIIVAGVIVWYYGFRPEY